MAPSALVPYETVGSFLCTLLISVTCTIDSWSASTLGIWAQEMSLLFVTGSNSTSSLISIMCYFVLEASISWRNVVLLRSVTVSCWGASFLLLSEKKIWVFKASSSVQSIIRHIFCYHIINYPLFADANMQIYPHAASQYHTPAKKIYSSCSNVFPTLNTPILTA